MIKATFEALGRVVNPRAVPARRGKKVSDRLGGSKEDEVSE